MRYIEKPFQPNSRTALASIIIIQALGLADILFIFNIDGSAKSYYSLRYYYICHKIEAGLSSLAKDNVRT